MRSSDHKQKLWVEARRAKIQQMYENLEFDFDLKLLFIVTGAKIQQTYEDLELDLDLKLLFMATGPYYESGMCFSKTTKG